MKPKNTGTNCLTIGVVEAQNCARIVRTSTRNPSSALQTSSTGSARADYQPSLPQPALCSIQRTLKSWHATKTPAAPRPGGRSTD